MRRAAVRTTCPYCGVGCGVIATREPDGNVAIAGDPDHPANFGRLCSKGAALGETLDLSDRLLTPMVDGAPATWSQALDRTARAFRDAIDAHGPDSVAFYVSGQMLTEDYYVANKLMKGFIGSANIDTNSRLCMASTVAGHRRAFGADTVPGVYEDLELADLVVLVGSNLAWCHPVLYQRLAAAKAARPEMRVVVVDPRETATCGIADLHLALNPGSDVPLFLGLLDNLRDAGAIDQAYIAAHVEGLAETLAMAQAVGADGAAAATGLGGQDLALFYRWFAETAKTVTVFSQGVNQSSAGTDKVGAILNCHLATARIGRPGMGPFSVTGQPNAMGGREVGGLANQLAAHMSLDDPADRDRVQRFWRSPAIADRPGLKAVDLFRAVGDGRIKALLVMATNPVVSMPEADVVRAALEACPFVAIADVTADTDTARLADVLLPAAAWGEKDGTVTNSERRISRQRAFSPLPGRSEGEGAGARPDWWIICELARRLGYGNAFAYDGPAAIFREYAGLTAFENDGRRDLDLGGLAELNAARYDALEPTPWPVPRHGAGPRRFFADGRFCHPDGKARMVPTPPRLPAALARGAWPFVLNSGRVRDQWHTMTRTAKTPRLMQHLAEPFVEVAPQDAMRLGLRPADLAEVESPHGRVIVRVLITDRQRPGRVFVPMHWTDRFASAARVDTLIAANTDPVSGQPEFKAMPVALRRFRAGWYGFAVSVAHPDASGLAYWALARAQGGWRVELADTGPAPDLGALAGRLFGPVTDDTESLLYQDSVTGRARLAILRDGRVAGLLYLCATPVAVSREWACQWLRAGVLDAADRQRLLAGRAGAGGEDPGAIVCSCETVGLNRIVDAVVRAGCTTVDAVGAACRAGTNCGSCRAEVQRIIDHAQLKKTG
ncbi:MAG: molybdopterin-dependent oxidoreductase [Alphaproteobacteria bacterium]